MESNVRPLVSLVTPSYNQAAFLADTLASVRAQTWPAVEHIVMDGGSTDGSVATLERHAGHLAHWETGRDAGFADALRKGFERSTGDVLGYLNSDDLLAPRAVEEAVGFLAAHPDVDLVYGNRICIDEQGRLLYVRPSPPLGARTLHAHHVLGQETCFWRREAYVRVGGIDARMAFAVDYDLFSRIARSGRVAHCGRIWGFFRKHGASKTMTAFATTGTAEIGQVQDAIWGRRPGALESSVVHAACRAYTVAYGTFLETARWPAGVPRPPSAPFGERVARSLRSDSLAARLLGRCRRP